MKTKYFIHTLNLKYLWRWNGKVFHLSGNTPNDWTVAVFIITLADLQIANIYHQISRDEARKLFPRAFRKVRVKLWAIQIFGLPQIKLPLHL